MANRPMYIPDPKRTADPVPLPQNPMRSGEKFLIYPIIVTSPRVQAHPYRVDPTRAR